MDTIAEADAIIVLPQAQSRGRHALDSNACVIEDDDASECWMA